MRQTVQFPSRPFATPDPNYTQGAIKYNLQLQDYMAISILYLLADSALEVIKPRKGFV